MTLLLILASLAYIATLFAVAHWGDKPNSWANRISYKPIIYSMSLAIYCTSWTYYGAVGNAASGGWAYIPILLGPFLLFVFALPLVEKLVSVSKQQNITSIADFIASRYGKRQRLALFVTLIAALATIPYIALQLKAVGLTFVVLTENTSALTQFSINELVAAAIMAVFAMLFGTRHIEVTEYRNGMILAIAFESAVKLVALLAAAVFAYLLFSEASPTSMWQQLSHPTSKAWSWEALTEFDFIVQTFMAAGVILCLPRQFHVAVVDNVNVNHLKTARWGFPLYLVLIAAAIVPIALSGSLFLGGVDGDTYALRLPLLHDQTWLAVFIYIGGFSAATAMVIIASVTLSTMVTNDVIMPIILQRRSSLPTSFPTGFQRRLLLIRRVAIAIILLLSYLCYYFWAAGTGLVSIGLLAFSVVLQLLPAVLGGLYWRRGHARGVYVGLGTGLIAWLFAVAVPMYLPHDSTDTSIITQGTVISLAVNTAFYIIFSLMAQPRLIDRIQATAFVKPRSRVQEHTVGRHHQATNGDMMLLLQTFVGEQRTAQLLDYFAESQGNNTSHTNKEDVASREFIDYVERVLTGVLGAATARSLVEAALRDRRLHLEEVVHFFDDTTQALQTQQSILFSSLENLAQGISVVDAELRLVAWNKRYLDLFNYPDGMVKPGQPIATLIRYNAERGECGPGEIEELVAKRLKHMQVGSPHRFIRRRGDGRVIEMVGNPLPNGGFVTSFTDITEHVETQQALEEANIDLEQRINIRQKKIREINNELTEEIDRRRTVEVELKKAKQEAEEANASKTRFLALASHDILQPLNAARLYLSAMDEQTLSPNNLQLTQKLDTALASTEHLLSTLLQIAKMDQGALQPRFRHVRLSSVLQPLLHEYSVLAEQRGINLKARIHDGVVYTDPTYLRRIVQNFLSNAVKYNRDNGKVLLGVRRRGDYLLIAVYDTGLGITAQQRHRIFDAFYRGSNTRVEGVGLGLSVAKRMSEQLHCELRLQTVEGSGSCFSVQVPLGNEAQVHEKPAQPNTSDLHQGLTMVCVDDDQENLNAMRALLEKWGCTVETFTSSATALEYAATHPRPTGILLDYQLGDDEHDGLSLAQELRKLWGDNLSGALVTAMNDDGVRSRARAEQLHFLAKPVKPAALKSLLKYLDR
ncbi:PAS domain-containing hybrid sensor histidine kinase/response regulator [Pseudidiomarina donghaiensis]|uniref:histidine kinase n=1 Tax=Pseudidiomarina donghaiensis TaxID=519452 RepID=A0A432XKY7_9GAMM|nr:PAS-domain containing protein [Pseudidiomarina donghaiensis]RUO49356.1 sensor histidine kinase [Pseudidiomarina donghaiensis]SFV21060.1 PAS domain S-box-containing protein [Pseudidiomarina donghaiensis]